MSFSYNKKLTENSQSLRKNLTVEERKLWYEFLKDLPVTVHRQKTIGNYIVDFYCAATKTVIELNGSQHYDGKVEISDRLRDDYLNSLGIKVLRYGNYDVNTDFDSVCKDILKNFGLLN